MAQGKMKVKGKLPDKAKQKNKKTKGPAITKRSNAPIQSKKEKTKESQKLKKIVTKVVNKKMEDEIRSRAMDRKTTLSKAQQAMVAHNAATSSKS